MFEETGWIVRSVAGHDKGDLFCVVGGEGQFFLLADGKRRKLAYPKRKKRIHAEVMDERYIHPVLEMLREGEAVTDRALRRALAAFREESRRV